MTGIADLVVAGKEFGIFQFYLPFVILFAILYGLLQKSKIFGDKAKAINVIISLAASLFVMEYALSGILATFFATFFAGTLAILVTILGFLMVTYLLLAIFGEEGKAMPDAKKYAKYVVLIGALLAAATFVSSGGAAIFPGFVIGTVTEVPNLIFPSLNLSTQDVGIILLVALFVGIVIFLVRGEGGGKGKKLIGYKPVPQYE